MYKIGDIFYEDEHYGERAQFCNENGLVIVEIAPDEEGNRRFQIQAIPSPSAKEQAEQEIAELKRALADTDYKAIKYAEGLLTAEEYEQTKRQRAVWRARINELEAVE